jgi:hypothetical protein
VSNNKEFYSQLTVETKHRIETHRSQKSVTAATCPRFAMIRHQNAITSAFLNILRGMPLVCALVGTWRLRHRWKWHFQSLLYLIHTSFGNFIYIKQNHIVEYPRGCM